MNNKKRVCRICPVCGEQYGEVLFTLKMQLFQNISLPSEYDVVSCTNCGFTYADTTASQKDYNEYYSECNMYSCDAAIKANADKLNRIYYKQINFYIDKKQSILDIGFGSGDLLLDLKKKGYNNLYGIDPSEESVIRLREMGIDCEKGNIFEEVSAHLKKSFDCVVCTAVMEHICDLKNFIASIKEYLKDDGSIYVSVPAVEGFEKYYMKIPNYFNHEHINYFSLLSLDRLFWENGFERISSLEESLFSVNNELAIGAFYRLVDIEKRIWDKDIISKKSIISYLDKAKEVEMIDLLKINSFLDKNEKIVIWGVGSYTLQLLEKVQDIKEKVVYFIDNNVIKCGTKIMDIEVHAPKILLEKGNEYPILICSMKNAEDIRHQIESMGIANEYLSI